MESFWGCFWTLFWECFGLYLFLANLPLNMLVTLASNLFHENLLKKTNFFGGVFWTVTCFGESAAECEYPANPG